MNSPATYAVIITAAGRGTRAGDGPPKQWRDLAGQSVLARSIKALAKNVEQAAGSQRR